MKFEWLSDDANNILELTKRAHEIYEQELKNTDKKLSKAEKDKLNLQICKQELKKFMQDRDAYLGRRKINMIKNNNQTEEDEDLLDDELDLDEDLLNDDLDDLDFDELMDMMDEDD